MSAENNVPAIRFEGFSGEWEVLKLGDIATLSSGGTPSRKISKYWNGTIPWITTALLNFNVIKVAEEHITSEGLEDSSAKLLPENTLLMAMYGQGKTRGKIAILGIEAATNQACAAIKLNHEVDNIYIFQSLSSQYRGIRELSNAGGQENLSASLIKEINVSIPLLNEQTKIGQYFQQLDTLITQHQQKHDKLLQLKKSLLEKMFPQQGATEPAIRFKGFSGKWEEKRFGDSFSNIPNNTLSRSELNYKIGLAKNVHYGDVLIKFGEVLDVQKEMLPFITNDEVCNKLKKTNLQDGDIVFADAAEDETVGKCTELFNIKEQVVLSGLHTIAVRPTLPFASKYLGYYLNASSYHNQLLSLMQGTKVLSVSKTAIQNTSITFPSIFEEQTKIGNLLNQFDTLLSQHQTQLKKLKQIKQACLEKMFV